MTTAFLRSSQAILWAVVCGLGLALPSPVHGVCGDGILDGGELCDDGNTDAGDCCDATCSSPCDSGSDCGVLCFDVLSCVATSQGVPQCDCNVGGCPLTSGEYSLALSGGTLAVGSISAFPLPTGGSLTLNVGASVNTSCTHNVTVPAGGFSLPGFCLPTLDLNVEISQAGCGVGRIDSDGGGDFTLDETGDTSDSLSGVCGSADPSCSLGTTTDLRVDVVVGDATPDTCATGVGNALVSIPVTTRVWIESVGSCPGNGSYDPGVDTLIADLQQVLDLTTDTATARFSDIDADGCSLAGVGPVGPFANTGSCIDYTSMTTSLVASGPVGSDGGPLWDVLFTTVLPSSMSATGPFPGGSCAVPPEISLGGGSVTRCIP